MSGESRALDIQSREGWGFRSSQVSGLWMTTERWHVGHVGHVGPVGIGPVVSWGKIRYHFL